MTLYVRPLPRDLKSTPAPWPRRGNTEDKFMYTAWNQSLTKMKATIFSSAVSSGKEKCGLASIFFFFLHPMVVQRSGDQKPRQKTHSGKVRIQWAVGGRFKLDAVGESSVLHMLSIHPCQLESLKTECPVLQINWCHYFCGSPWPTTTRYCLWTSTAIIKHSTLLECCDYECKDHLHSLASCCLSRCASR